MAKKSCLFIIKTAPHGTITAQETLDVLLTYAAFGLTVSLIFVEDGVFQLMANQQTTALGLKNFAATFRALEDYEVESVYVDKASLESRGLKKEDLLINIDVIEKDQQQALITSNNLVFNLG